MFFVWASLSTGQNWNLHCSLLWREKLTYYDSFYNKCRSDFLTVVMTTKERVLSMTLLRNVLTWLPSQQKKLRQHSVLLIWLSDLEDFKSLFWRAQWTNNTKPKWNKKQVRRRNIYFFEMIPSPGRDQRLTARVAPGINLGVVQGKTWKFRKIDYYFQNFCETA